MSNPLNAKAPSTFIEVSDSQVKLFQTCQRSWAYQKLLGIEPQEDKTSLVFGVGVHEGLEYLHKGSSEAEAVAVVGPKMHKTPGDWAEEQQLAEAMVRGYTRFHYPLFCNYWQTDASEEWFEYFPDPVVKFRGYRDLRCSLKLDRGHFKVSDFKTTSYKDGGDLGKTVKKNHQLAGYSISYVRQHGVWPNEISLSFLQKPKNADVSTRVDRALNDPGLYSEKSEPVTPDFANFAIAVEQEIVTTGRQMFALKRLYETQGVAALDAALPNFNNCFNYGRWCGFTDGCHGCKPAHRVMMGQV